MTIFSFGDEWKSEKTQLSQRVVDNTVPIKQQNAKGLMISKAL